MKKLTPTSEKINHHDNYRHEATAAHRGELDRTPGEGSPARALRIYALPCQISAH